MLVGDKIKQKYPSFGTDVTPKDLPRDIEGVVVYIHPQRRYYTVEFKLGDSKIRESYRFK